jgi:cytochrome c biogenesis protein CcmG/thiol:disulfide interchange protein DsbE
MRKTLILACVVPLFIFADAVRERAPDFTRVDAAGHNVRLSKYRGKVVLLDFWATWCTGCKEEIPWYMEFADKYGKKGLNVIGVSMDDDGWKAVRPFLAEKMKLNYPVVIGDDALAEQFGGIKSLPATLLIDRQGRIAYSHIGVVDKVEFEGKIQELLRRAR